MSPEDNILALYMHHLLLRIRLVETELADLACSISKLVDLQCLEGNVLDASLDSALPDSLDGGAALRHGSARRQSRCPLGVELAYSDRVTLVEGSDEFRVGGIDVRLEVARLRGPSQDQQRNGKKHGFHRFDAPFLGCQCRYIGNIGIRLKRSVTPPSAKPPSLGPHF